ncbi:MAG TPA: septal ring lytic transglycosylase RlpA family protein [Steroidobacteraceae bacterium]
MQRFAGAIPVALVAGLALGFSPPGAAKSPHRGAPQRVTGPAKPDLSARKRRGNASYYARRFFGKPMANGAPMNPRGNNAASRTLPLGTVARVTNVATGKSAVIKIEDRGPYIKGRIVDLSPSTARAIGITKRIGVAKVVVAPIAVPLPDGRVKLASSLPRKSHTPERVARE